MKKDKENEIILKTSEYLQEVFSHEGSGHDWFHIDRVRNLALKIWKTEGGDRYLIEMSALMHDLDDWKLTGKNQANRTEAWLRRLKVSPEVAHDITEVIKQVSFKGAGVPDQVKTLEAAIVQDADRLDAMGAIGIARTFAYGGYKKRLIYHPGIHPEIHTPVFRIDFRKNTYMSQKQLLINFLFEKWVSRGIFRACLSERRRIEVAVQVSR